MIAATQRPAEELDLDVWADLSQSAAIAKRFTGDPDAALSAARLALGYRNVAVQRNALRLIEAAFAKKAPLKAGHPALAALDSACVDGRPLVMWEAMAAGRRLQKKKEHDLSAPYPGLVDGRRSDTAIWAWVWGGPGSLSYMRMRTRDSMTPDQYRVLVAESSVPERELLAGLEAKRRKPKQGDADYDADLSKPVFTDEELETSLGKRVFHFHNWYPCKWEIFEGRNFVRMASRDRTPSEDAWVWQVEFVERLLNFQREWRGPLAYGTPVMGLQRLQGPRGKVLKELCADLENRDGDDAASNAARFFARFVEDPLLLDAVQKGLASPKRQARVRASATAAVLGDEGSLERAKAAMKSAGAQAIDHVWALGFLGDRRGLDLVWQIAEAANTPDQALLAAAMFDEVSAGWEGRIAANPKWAANEAVRYALCARWSGRELDGLLRIVELASTAGLDEAVLKRFALTKSQRWSFTWQETEFKAQGFVRGADGTWARDPALPPLTPEEFEKVKDSYEWRQVAAANRYFGPHPTPLEYGSTRADWTGALMRHFAKQVANGSLGMEGRALALRRLAIVAGEDAAERCDAALAAVPAAEAKAIRALAPPEKRKGGKKK